MFREKSRALEQFKDKVGMRFQLYNGLFTSLPIHKIENTGVLLAMLLSMCEEGFQKGESPKQIIDNFFSRQTMLTTEREKNDILFRFIQFAERQVVLFDALEDAAFGSVNDLSGPGTLKNLFSRTEASGSEDLLREKLHSFCVQVVLTAHPTQFYPGAVLGIINDLSKSIKQNNVGEINMYLQQLGKTPFLKKQKPTPFDEAVSMIWYLENVFYYAAGKIVAEFEEHSPGIIHASNPVIKAGFWPGGDRDGNPFVTSETTLRVAAALRNAILRCYYRDVQNLRRRLTFRGIEEIVIFLEAKLYDCVYASADISMAELSEALKKIKSLLINEHDSLFIDLLNNLEYKTTVFALHFATLDVRQESSVHGVILSEIAAKQNILPANYAALASADKLRSFDFIAGAAEPELYSDQVKDCLLTVSAIKKIQSTNGEAGCNRYIISQCRSALHVMEVYALFLLTGVHKKELFVDIVPLFETIDDLERAGDIMQELYSLPLYRRHLELRGRKQTIMLGFSDGTKDGGYLMANWAIYKAKETLTRISRNDDIEVVFFDGRGGPPSRGGGKTHQFYASLGSDIENKEIQITVQGQTVSSSFGTTDAAKYNMEQLISAGLSNEIFSDAKTTFSPDREKMMKELADVSLQKYLALKEHPDFMLYLNDISPLKYYSETNIGSRPAKRGKGQLTFADLRAIPYVGAWSQLKQNVSGYYGVGTAFRKMDEEGRLEEVKAFYAESMFFKTLLENCEMAMKKTWFPLTAYLADHPVYGAIRQLIFDEFELTKKYILLISGRNELMENYPVDNLSIQMRERIVLPLSTIQQYAICRTNEKEITPEQTTVFRNMIIRSSFGIINAARNAV